MIEERETEAVNNPNQPVRNWLNEHPATATYIAFIVTVILLLQINETLHFF